MTTECWRAPEPQMQFHVLSFEGPDAYAQAGGIASRITGLTQALATAGFETHLWFVGDPDLPGHETQGQLRLHRWCQWISRYHPGWVYAGEEVKQDDYAASLPPWKYVPGQKFLLPPSHPSLPPPGGKGKLWGINLCVTHSDNIG